MAGSSKEKMKSLLAGEQAKPEIQRGQGVCLSTQAEPETQNRRNANTEGKRVNRGYMLREDYI